MTATHLLTQKVSFKAPAGMSISGDPTYGALTTLPCRVVRRVDTVRSSSGATRQESTVIVTEKEIPANSLVWLEGDDVTDQKKARAVGNRTFASFPSRTYSLFETIL